MARTLPHSKLNPRKRDADQAYNRAIDRGADLDLTEVEDQAPVNTNVKLGNKRLSDTKSKG